MKTILTILLMVNILLSISNAQHRRIERQQDIGGYTALFATAGLAYGITYFAHPYIFFDGEFNNSEKCAYLALGTLAAAITFNRYDDIIPLEIELTNDPNPGYWDDLEFVFYMQFQNWKPHASIEYYFTDNWYNIQYGVGYQKRIEYFMLETGGRLGICSGNGSLTGYLKESCEIKRFSLVLYQRFNINSRGNYPELRLGVNYKF